MTRVALWLATAGGAGYAPFASGTVGAAVGVVVFLLMRRFAPAAELPLLLAVTVAGVWAASAAARHFGKEDPGQIVIDEVAGQLVTYAFLDLTWSGIVIGFFLFRVFDIIKPPPARQLEGLHGGWGVMADDLMAGVYGWVALWAIVTFIPVLR